MDIRNTIRDMSIRNKFKVLAVMVGVVLISVTLISFVASSFLVRVNEEIYEQSTKGIEEIAEVQNTLNDTRNMEILAVTYAAVANVEKLADMETKFTKQKDQLLQKISDLRIDKEQKLSLGSEVLKYFELAAITFEKAGMYLTDDASRNVIENSRQPFGSMKDQFTTLMDERVERAHVQNQNALKYAALSKSLIFAAVVVTGAFFLLMIFLSRSITQPMNAMVEFVSKISRGELVENVAVASKDEIGMMGRALDAMGSYVRDMAETAELIAEGDLRVTVTPQSSRDVLGNAFHKMVAGLQGIIRDVKTGSDQMASASAQIATTSDEAAKNNESAATTIEETTATMHEMSANIQNVAKSSQSQATSVTETAASIEQMVTSIQRIADTTRQFAELAQRTKQAVDSGFAAVDKSSRGTTEISTSITRSADSIAALGSRAEDIGKIVDVIDDIAEQTNLLALNAAIEAARAGEQGLGFAVVADEVRQLAERSAKSTKEIAELISGIQKESQEAVRLMEKSIEVVDRGVELSGQVSEALRAIEGNVVEVDRYAKEIRAATQEQSNGSTQIAKATEDLRGITNEITSATDEQASAAEQIVRTMEKMRDMIHQNASGSIQLATSADELRKQADKFRGIVGKFSLNGSSGTGAEPPALIGRSGELREADGNGKGAASHEPRMIEETPA